MKNSFILFFVLFTAFSIAQTPDDEYFITVDIMPEYPGGQPALLEYIGTVKYPSEAKSKNITGTVYAKFIVEKNGEVNEVEVVKSSGSTLLDEAVIEHLGNMPSWSPGIQNGKKVRVQYVVPVTFKLTDHKSEKTEESKKSGANPLQEKKDKKRN